MPNVNREMMEKLLEKIDDTNFSVDSEAAETQAMTQGAVVETLMELQDQMEESAKTRNLFSAAIVLFAVSQLLLRVYEMFDGSALANLITLLMILFLTVLGVFIGQNAVVRGLGWE